MAAIPDSGNSGSSSFQKIADAFLSQPGLPFADVLSAERIERTFARHVNLFGGSAYSTAVMVWACHDRLGWSKQLMTPSPKR